MTKIYHLFIAGGGKFNLCDNDMKSLTRGFGPINHITGILKQNSQAKSIMTYYPHEKEGWKLFDMKGVKQNESFDTSQL